MTSTQIDQLRNDFPGLYDYYTRQINNIPAGMNATSAQHQAMAQHYRQIIVSALKEFDNSEHDDQLYNALSWTGLKNTIAWNLLPARTKDNINLEVQNFMNNNSSCN